MPAEHSRSILGVAGEAMAQAADLIRVEFRLARAELAEKIGSLRTGAAFVVAGAVFLIGALFLLLQWAVVALVEAGLSAAMATFMVAMASCLIGLVLILAGRQKLDPSAVLPERTLNQIARDGAMAKEKLL
ncbi:phage holin family protein [Reyranella sp.]|uniref:phage holin family protein n=1 Tax=Reyranella sp. TaxID=1929291 RepID=UPI003D0A75EE